MKLKHQIYKPLITSSTTRIAMPCICPNCGKKLIEYAVFSEFRDSNGWICDKCKQFYSQKEIKQIVFNV
jgi:predicted RNA-binding Zn-ribbon protein involved in translation (DUF1610 family)